jgi:hypothetical protein
MLHISCRSNAGMAAFLETFSPWRTTLAQLGSCRQVFVPFWCAFAFPRCVDTGSLGECVQLLCAHLSDCCPCSVSTTCVCQSVCESSRSVFATGFPYNEGRIRADALLEEPACAPFLQNFTCDMLRPGTCVIENNLNGAHARIIRRDGWCARAHACAAIANNPDCSVPAVPTGDTNETLS